MKTTENEEGQNEDNQNEDGQMIMVHCYMWLCRSFNFPFWIYLNFILDNLTMPLEKKLSKHKGFVNNTFPMKATGIHFNQPGHNFAI